MVQRMARDQTLAVFEPLRKRIDDAVAKLEEQIATTSGDTASEAELDRANTVLSQAKTTNDGAP